VYCGYRRENPIERTLLSEEEIERELRSVRSHGFDHVLLVTGDHPKVAGIEYVGKALTIAGQSFGTVSLEVQPLRVGEYAALRTYGLHSVYVYQETYNRTRWRLYHPKGMKSHFYHRLETPDRIARAGVGKVGLGVLLGLEDWRTDSFFAALHAAYLFEAYPGLRVSLSFPRLRPAEGGVRPNVTLSDRQLIQLICAYRLCFPELEMSLSTRESSEFRDRAVSLGITSMSAGSRTSPGGYATHAHALEQFEICDIRSAEDVAGMIVAQGYEPVWSERTFVSRPHPSFV
jgi:2-iminoacetate synthase